MIPSPLSRAIHMHTQKPPQKPSDEDKSSGCTMLRHAMHLVTVGPKLRFHNPQGALQDVALRLVLAQPTGWPKSNYIDG